MDGCRTIAVTGYEGRLGSMLVEAGFSPFPCDITNRKSICFALDNIKPDIIINCAAYTDVDEAENVPDQVFAINQRGVILLREAFIGWLIQISTDYVFGGSKGPYSEWSKREGDEAKGVYGRSKALSEIVVLNSGNPGTIVRTTILYGHPNYPDFVTKVLDKLELDKPFGVSTRLIGSPTYVPHLVEGLAYLINNCQEKPPMIIHIAGSDVLSRYEFALMIASVWGYDKQLIQPIQSIKGMDYRPIKAGLKVSRAEHKGIPIYSVIEGLEKMKHEKERLL